MGTATPVMDGLGNLMILEKPKEFPEREKWSKKMRFILRQSKRRTYTMTQLERSLKGRKVTHNF
jgi:hypothetical protein